MKRKSKRFVKKTTIEPFYDLFGDVIVTLFDIYMWVSVITHGRFLGNMRRYNHYVKNWNVAYKVANAKKVGFFEQIENEYFNEYHSTVWMPPQISDYLKAT
jgi:hypothetical protein